MNSSVFTIVLLITAAAVQACHHDKDDYPPDDCSEFENIQDGDDNGGCRKKRSLRAVDVDQEVSDFFTRCMHEKTGSFFPSWKSVIDFVLRDTRWYSASDEQYCPENSNRDPNSVRCWQGRLEKLVKLNSKLLPKAKECIQEFQWSKEEGPFIIRRGKRQAHGSTGTDPCLGITLSKYGQCVQDNLLTRSNLREYPSLAQWDGKSVQQFVLEHFSDCRITARYTRSRGNVYTETCPPSHVIKPPKCLSTIYREILRSPSPLAGSTNTCTEKYTNDRCKNIRCSRPNESCDKNTAKCVCDPGYQRNSRGNCVPTDKCYLVYCKDPREVCNQNTGECVCRPGYQKRNNVCILVTTDPCAIRQCGVNERCVPYQGTPYCICKTGFQRVNGECASPDPCRGVYCETNAKCENQNNKPVCVCESGYTLIGGTCQQANPCGGACPPNSACVSDQCVCSQGYEPRGQRCVPTNPCRNVGCGAFSTCVGGQCICTTGYERKSGRCVPINPCANVQCGPNSMCVGGQCICDNGYRRRSGRCVPINPCANVQCGPKSKCVGGQCICDNGYERKSGRCVPINPCANVLCGPNSMCVGGQCICDNGYEKKSGRCVPINPCANVQCGPNSKCVGDQCICDNGYERKSGVCVPKNPCEGAQCPPNMRCRPDSDGLPECVCKPGFVRNRGGSPGCVTPDPCDGKTCPVNSGCIAGECVCNKDFEKNAQDRCVRKNPCRGVSCGKNKVCRRRDPDYECVCRNGFVEDGATCRRPNPCDDVTCSANSQCLLGQCVCSSGFTKAADGQCEPTDPCAAVQCGPTTFCDSGVCICRPGFTEDSAGNCIEDDVCNGFCSANEKCTAEDGFPVCECLDGFERNEFGECLDFDPCEDVICDDNMECRAGGCFCLDGFAKSLQNPGCEELIIDLCLNVACPPQSKCEDGTCVCNDGFIQHPSGFCVPPSNGCIDIQCEQNMRCVDGSCSCNPDFVPAPEGPGCVSSTGQWLPWEAWSECSQTCGKGTRMRFRQCGGMNCDGVPIEDRTCNDIPCGPSTDDPCILGLPGAHRLDNGTCVVCPADKTFNQCPTACFATCGGPPPNPTVCFQACRQNVFCECRDGFVEKSITDSTCVRRQDCPGNWAEWGDWVRCTESCGGGVQLRSRTCNGDDCEGGETETRQCNTDACGPSGSCEPPKVFVPCPTRCPRTCGNRGLEIACESGCRQDTQCVCPEGMIETSTTDTTCVSPNQCPGLCFPNPCKHNGQCIPTGAYYRCRCQPGYSGRNCEIGCGEVCTSNGRCERGQCVCNSGFVPDGEGGCRR